MNKSKKHGTGSECKEDDDNDRLSTSSVESMDRILLPSKHVLDEIKKARKQHEESLKSIDKKLVKKSTSKRGTKNNFRCEKRKKKEQVVLEPSASKKTINDSSEVPISPRKNSRLLEKRKKNFRCGKYIKKGQAILEPSVKTKKNNSSKKSISQIKSSELLKEKTKSNDMVKNSHFNDKSISTVKRIPKKFKSNILADTSSQKSACCEGKEKKTETIRESYEEKEKVTETIGESSSNIKLSTSFDHSLSESKLERNEEKEKIIEAVGASSSSFQFPTFFDHGMSKITERDEENLWNSSASRPLKSSRSEKFKHVKNNNFQSSQVPDSNISQSSSDPQASTSMKSAESYDDAFGNVSLYNYLIEQIVVMNTKWLYEKGDSTSPPVYLMRNVDKLPLLFSSYPVYVNSFLPLIMLEIWERICQESKPILLSKNQNKFKFFVISFNKDNDLLKLQCESFIDNTLSYFPSDKSLVILDLIEKTGIFGFVTHDEKFLPHEISQNSNIVRFNIHVKFRPNFSPAQRELIEGNGICSLADKVKLLDALSSLKSSLVLHDILKPTWDTFFVPCTELLSTHDFMSIQNIICNAVVDAMKLPATCTKIILLEGVPGSGKTEVIPSICEKLVCNEKFCILITAPTDQAIDGIANKFIELNGALSTTNIRFLRLGDPESVCETVKPHSLPRKLEEVHKMWEERYSDWQSENNQVTKDIAHCHRKDSFHRKKYQELKIRKQKLNEMKVCAWNEIIEEKERRKICANANVILTKLDDFFEVYKYGFKFSCCFIDEINQATELESILPFTLEISKFFIIGDSMQLPPIVKSQTAIDCRLQRSILERFELYFNRIYKKSPAIILTDQFRMHREISSFPLCCFYGLDYGSHSFADNRSESWPLQPYMVLDDFSYLSNSSPYMKTGVHTIIEMCLFMLFSYSAANIGVIVPSQYEKELYLTVLNQITSSPNIEIETVEAFQGREKSVIVLSCYHDSFSKPDSIFTCKRRLNVALTRAYCSLIICGPLHLIDKCSLPYWEHLIADAQKRKCYRKLFSTDYIADIFKTYIFKESHHVK